jgi:hypothetical protein
MVGLRGLVASVALVAALVPMNAFAERTEEHMRAEVVNAEAQKAQASELAEQIRAAGQVNADNERVIAQLQSEAFRMRQLDLVANANALEQISKALALAYRVSGDLNARNELVIAQGKAAILLDKAKADMANALAQGRETEIANAKAQGILLMEAASFISGALAETNMSSAKIRGETQADMVHTPGLAEVANGQAMGAEELLAADAELAAGEVGAESAEVTSDEEASEVEDHAASSLHSAEVALEEVILEEQ